MSEAREQEPLGYLTTRQMCDELGVDPATLQRWVSNGIATAATRLPGRTGALLFAPAELERLRALRGDRKQMPRDVDVIGAAS